jgi:hypothetical protein
MMSDKGKISKILEFIDLHTVDGDHHKQWVLDQIVRIATDCPTVEGEGKDYKGTRIKFKALGKSQEYLNWVQARLDDDYDWDEGVAP